MMMMIVMIVESDADGNTVKSVLMVTCLERSSLLCGHSVFVPLQHIPC
jgi:hypothetical protein